MSILFSAIQILESKGESDTLFNCCPYMRCRSNSRTSISFRKFCCSKRATLYCSWWSCFFTVFCFTPLAFLMLFPLASRMLYIFGRNPTYSSIGVRRIRISSFQAPSRSQCCIAGGLIGSSKCRRGPNAWPCPGTHHRSGFRGAGRPYRCTVAGSALHLVVVKVVRLNSCKVIIKYVGPCKGWADNKAPELVFLLFVHEFDVNALAEVFHRLPKYRVVHQLIEVFFEVLASLLSKLGVHSDVELHPGPLLKA